MTTTKILIGLGVGLGVLYFLGSRKSIASVGVTTANNACPYVTPFEIEEHIQRVNKGEEYMYPVDCGYMYDYSRAQKPL